ncbi:MAG: helix-turn-helix transcriptional regulator [Polaromonas sp.]|nr:helix-turn-helix transcriptional regulator [Polaromonas sp.]MDP2819810.1 helix-turn-helix transcriptional regulator [Polaromonas sp.]
MGTTRSYITRLIWGNANLSVQTMTRLADAVGCPVLVQLEERQDTRPLT